MNKRYFKRSEGFVKQEVGGETILVPLVNSVAQMNEVLTLNEIGTFIYHELETEKSADDLLESILKNYEVSEAEAITDLNSFLEHAAGKHIIIELD